MQEIITQSPTKTADQFHSAGGGGIKWNSDVEFASASENDLFPVLLQKKIRGMKYKDAEKITYDW